jgi:hypothetical protein
MRGRMTWPRNAPAGLRATAGVVLLFLFALACYLPILLDGGGFQFLNVDDSDYVVNNPHVRAGLTAESVSWALRSFEHTVWQPVTWISFEIDAQLHGIDPSAFHVTNVLLHGTNTALLFLLLFRMTAAWGRSAVVAALFAAHPLHVESVAWVSERKDTLSTFFLLLTLIAYACYAKRPHWLRYLVVVAGMVLGLMAKSMLVTLPCLMLLLDCWPLHRFELSLDGAGRAVLEKLPLFALAAVGAFLNVRAQRPMMEAASPLPFAARAENALVYFVTYAGRTMWPADLIIFRPNPGVALPWLQVLACAFALVAVSALLLRFARAQPAAPVGWAWFLVTLVPVIGLVQFGFLATADHFTYVPLIGLFVALVWLAHDAIARLAPRPAVVVVAALVPICACAVLSRRQLAYWRSSVALWQHDVDVRPNDALAQSFLARSLDADGRSAEAEPHYARAAELDPTWRARVERALKLESQGEFWASTRELEAAILTAPNDPIARLHLARQFYDRGNLAQATKHYAALARIEPRNPLPEYELGVIDGDSGNAASACAHFRRAVAIDATYEEARAKLVGCDAGNAP